VAGFVSKRHNVLVNPFSAWMFKAVAHATFLCRLLSSPTASLQHSIRDLQPYTEYEVRVVASNGYGHAYSNWTSMTTAEDSKQSTLI